MAEFEISSSENLETNLSIECEGRILNQRAVKLTKGVNKVSVPIEIDNPKLWWTNGLGEQPLYTFNSTISDASGRFQMNSERIGIRSIEIVTDEDDKGKSFYVKLNGVPVFMKGANYIPQDNFQNRVTSDRYEHIIGSAAEANMNILRVWGGGIYEEDLFYDLCDEKGLLVWQDVMFACGMYPADDKYLENVAAEVTDNVERLRNHPSVALYCGNNENEISWYSWGWKDMYSNEIQKQYESDLKKLFYETIPDAIAKADPDRYYHPSSPIAGIGDDRPMEDGDTHYWGVWHGKEPFSEFENNVSRYISEYGFQSYPEFTSIKKFSIEEDWSLESDVMHAHQRCMSDERRDVDYGNRLINTYLERNFNTPKDFENYVYVVQALQAKGVKMAVETHRRNRTDEFCMGTMYWQINDCWPVASWSSIDYYGKWKALHYFAKKAYEQVLITHLEMEGNLGFYVVSDELNPLEDAVLSMRVLDFYGNEIWKENKQIDIKENTSAMYAQMSVEELLKGKDRSEVYVESQLEYSGEVIATNAYFFENEKQLKLPKVSIKHSMEKADSGNEKFVMLRNEFLQVQIKQTGAELVSVKLVSDDTEYLWQGDSLTWSDHAIIQFPFIGNLQEDRYKHEDQIYEMMSHGFARISKFEIMQAEEHYAVFRLRANEETLRIYPFQFDLEVKYELLDQQVVVSFRTSNKGLEEMFFSLGYHPGFNCPIGESDQMDDYYLEFNQKEKADRLVLKSNMIADTVDNYLSDQSTLKLSKKLFQKDAIILNPITSGQVALKNTLNQKSVTVSYDAVPYLGVWSPAQEGPFVCIEPWYGIPDLEGSSYDLKSKPGIMKLKSNESFDWVVRVAIQ
ncbi:MANBA [Symbiodinium microadriaticum]|nr:MANBA [Symbiodinium microadriaticum]